MKYLQSVLVLSLEKVKVSLTIYSLTVNGNKIGRRNFVTYTMAC